MRYQYYYVRKSKIIRSEEVGDIIKGCWIFRAPFHPTDMTKTYVLNGYAIGRKGLKDMLAKNEIERISKKEAVEFLLRRLR